VTGDLDTFLAARLDEARHGAEAMEHDRDWDDDYRSCLVARIGTMADKGYTEADCNCGLAERKAQALREVEAKRDLIAAILAEPHHRWPGVSACLKATFPDEECACGRDARVERLLSIMAQAYEEKS
jgi:hypothetical protein